MRKSRFTEPQTVVVLKQAKAEVPVQDLIRRYGISEQTVYLWRKQAGGLGASELQQLKQLREENRRLIGLVADLTLDKRWSMDFVTDQLADGRYFRVFTVVDQFSRECVALHVAISIHSKDVGEVLDAAIRRRSAPAAITSDNGTEFTSRYFDAWAYFRTIDLDFIRQGKPVENAFIESFNGRFRDECLSQTWFTGLDDAQAAMAAWARDYNESWPHTSLGLPPSSTPPSYWLGRLWRRPSKPRIPRNPWSSVGGVLSEAP